jgi:hypothetical protein
MKRNRVTNECIDTRYMDVLERLQSYHPSVRESHAKLVQRFLPISIIFQLPMDMWIIICSYFPLLTALIVHQDTKMIYTTRLLRCVPPAKLWDIVLDVKTVTTRYHWFCSVCCDYNDVDAKGQQVCWKCMSRLLLSSYDLDHLYGKFKGVRPYLDSDLKLQLFYSLRLNMKVLVVSHIQRRIETALKEKETPKSIRPVLMNMWCYVQSIYLAP